ncbi:hypothetical protein EVAR_32876_1 [Eumeta japonica]|uniref:Uncharacterized protein n=1 Tax=Eumeta variegata TaxID=151549 RepID=A0A4C1VTC4_EUMVA|nr:hypothetical protein EVAR_32876_1 [Eumeta japonica]
MKQIHSMFTGAKPEAHFNNKKKMLNSNLRPPKQAGDRQQSVWRIEREAVKVTAALKSSQAPPAHKRRMKRSREPGA